MGGKSNEEGNANAGAMGTTQARPLHEARVANSKAAQATLRDAENFMDETHETAMAPSSCLPAGSR